METILALLSLLSFGGIMIGFVSAIIKKIIKKSAKKSLKLTGISFLILIFTIIAFPNVSTEQNNESKGQIDESNLSDNSLEELKNTASESNQNKNNKDKNYIGNDLWIEELTDFSEGRAWIQFSESHREYGSIEATTKAVKTAMKMKEDDYEPNLYEIYEIQNWQGNERAALIDTQGKIIWESELTENNIVLKETNEFRNGLTYCVFDGNDKSSYLIIDVDGNVTFTHDCNEDYKILCHGNELFLIAEHIKNFDSNEWRIGAIDKNGNVVAPFQTYEKTPPFGPEAIEAPQGEAPDPNYDYWGYLEYQKQLEAHEEYINYSYTPEIISFDEKYISCEYLGENIFKINFTDYYVLLNINTQQIIYTYSNENENNIKNFLSNFENDKAEVLYGNYNNSAICSLGTDGSFTPTISNIWTKRLLGERVNLVEYESNKFHEELIFVPYNPLIDKEVFIDREFYEETGDLETATENGFTFYTGVYYNPNGEVIIDFPEYRENYKYNCSLFYNGYAAMQILGADGLSYITAINKNGELMFEPKSDFDTVYISEDGKYITAVKNGSVTVFDINGNSLVSIEYTGITSNNTIEYNVYDGVIKMKDFYVNIEDGTVIGLHYGEDLSIIMH